MPLERTQQLPEARRREAGARPRLVIADDDSLVRRVVRDTLQRAGVIVIAEATTGRECIELSLHYRPDAIVVDINMPDGDGLEVIRTLRAAGLKAEIVVLTGRSEDDLAVEALSAGASGYILKSQAVDKLPRAIFSALDGQAAISRRTERLLIDTLQSQARASGAPGNGMRPVRSPLTSREWEVLDLLCEGFATGDIAEELTLSTETVRTHVKHIRSKLGVKTRKEAVELAPSLRMVI